jgi:hypothetical protein
MNERIQELREQSIKWAYENQQSMNGAMDKFAELLIREYEQFLPEICPWSKADKKGPMEGWHVQFVARKHFGIEE